MDSSIGLRSPPPLSSLLEGRKVALFLDFDGTLVELAPGPDAINPRPDLSDRLHELSSRVDGRCAVVSGRAISDIESHTGPLKIPAAGSHGTEIRGPNGEMHGNVPGSFPPEIERTMRAFASENGVDYEAKPHGGALHYRSNPERGEEAVRFAENLAQTYGWAAQHGKCVVELVAQDSNKGSAVRTLMQTAAFGGSRPFFIGDDLTDEAGFSACTDLGGAGILVGEREPTQARYQLPDVSSVHEWLEL